jgi:oligopeptide transport system ATP-binding protein
MQRLLDIRGLDVRFATSDGEVAAVQALDLHIGTGECLGLIGESGSGKSQIFLASLGLLARNGRASGSVRFDGVELIGSDRATLERIRGARVAMVFQDPGTALAPHLTVGEQLIEVLEAHSGLGPEAARRRALQMLERVHIGDAAARLGQYPHELSGGMRQRVLIACALLCDPQLVIADEPTTALDVTVQAEILSLFRELRRESQLSLVVISHDAGVVAELCDRVAVIYAGRVVEEAPVRQIFRSPRHPYTEALFAAVPRVDGDLEQPLRAIAGQPPSLVGDVRGCSFADRCPRVSAECRTERPPLVRDPAGEGAVACHHPRPGAPQ